MNERLLHESVRRPAVKTAVEEIAEVFVGQVAADHYGDQNTQWFMEMEDIVRDHIEDALTHVALVEPAEWNAEGADEAADLERSRMAGL